MDSTSFSTTQCAGASRSRAGGYLPIEDYGMIGNMHTCALVGMDGGIDFMCWPDFDSPSVFCRLLDQEKGGYFSISPVKTRTCTTKQQYLPSSCLLQTRYIHEDGVVDLVDFFPRPQETRLPVQNPQHTTHSDITRVPANLKKWLIRRVECIRGNLSLDVEIFPAFEYARETHVTKFYQRPEQSKVISFQGTHCKLQLDVTLDKADDSGVLPTIEFEAVKNPGLLGEGAVAHLQLSEGQSVSFVLRDEIPNESADTVTTEVLNKQQHGTLSFWHQWIGRSKYKGRWREVVSRSLMILKMLTYEPTGAIIAAPTFSIPEEIGGVRNWDYRYSWVRDASFTIYILLRLGFVSEADAYMDFINERLLKSRGPNNELPIMFTIRGGTEIPEIELSHFEGYRKSKPVRIGNEAVFHQQFDIYGELMDTVYLYNKYGKPVTWDQWVTIRKMLDFVLTIMDLPDMSIWEVRSQKQNFIYSKIMLWVAFDRGLRLAEKRCLPCPNRARWLTARDSLMEEVMEKGYNPQLKAFVQSYENNTVLDASILIAPLVFFIAPNDPRFLSTMERILLPPEKGGLTSTGLVHRYNLELSADEGGEGAFSMCTFWLIEAMTRAGVYEPEYLSRAINVFENMLSFSNHVSMFSEEISRSGEQLGNTPQAFSHIALISAAFNLDRAAEFRKY